MNNIFCTLSQVGENQNQLSVYRGISKSFHYHENEPYLTRTMSMQKFSTYELQLKKASF